MPSKKKNSSNAISITRVYDAPVKRVWDAWVIPEQVAEWWGPRGFTLTTRTKDVKPGGTWNYTMHGPDGKDWENRTTFLEVVLHEKLVYDHGANDEQGPLFRVTVTFSERGGKTTMEMQMVLPTPEEAEKTRAFVKQAGGNATWDRLAEFLEKRTSDREVFVINRSFDAPVDVLFAMWTDPKHMAAWTPPTGFTMEFLRAEIREGGTSFYRMSNGAGVTMYGTATYLEIEKPSRMVYLQRFVDEAEKVARHPLAPTWPETMRTVVELTPEGPNETRVTVTWEPYGEVTREELAVFLAGRTGMTGGWTGSFDKLDEALAARAENADPTPGLSA
jgi:uncharacterized protein YndB with AHSA1/START domain